MHKEVAQKILEKIEEDYKKIALDFSSTRQNNWPDLLPLLKYVRRDDKILDLGSGNGRLFELLKIKEVNYLGIDNCDLLLAEASQRYPEARFQKENILDLSFDPNEFNIVFMIAVLAHFPLQSWRLKILKKIREILKPQGYLILTSWNLWQFTFRKKSLWRYQADKILRSKKDFFKRTGFQKSDLGFRDILTFWQGREAEALLYYYAFTLKELEELVKEAEFKIVESYYSPKGFKVNWYNGYNLVIVAQK